MCTDAERAVARMNAVQASCQQTIARIDDRQKSAEQTLAEMRKVLSRWDTMKKHFSDALDDALSAWMKANVDFTIVDCAF